MLGLLLMVAIVVIVFVLHATGRLDDPASARILVRDCVCI
jgi:hypothetical protein